MARTKTEPTLGEQLVQSLQEAAAWARGELDMPARVVETPHDVDVRVLRAKLKLSRTKFAERFGLDARAIQDWEQGRRRPDRSTRVLLRVIDREPEAVERALRAA